MKNLWRSRQMCEWDEFSQETTQLRARLAEDAAGALPPFQLLAAQGVDAAEHRRCSELWTRERRAASLPLRAALAFRHDLTDRPRLRIGYLSNDFSDHATLLLLIDSLEAHDRGRFDLHIFCFGRDDDRPLRRRLRAVAHGFHDVSGLDDSAIATAIHAAGIDILVDLKGFTQGARSGVLMLRPSPIQVNFLGYPGTLGAGLCDYIITDDYVTPPAAQADYAESFACMPDCYQPHGRAPLGAAPRRADAGLPPDAIVFCCFNQPFKITPPAFDMWLRLLEATPGSVLWLLSSVRAEGNLRGAAMARGIDARRLVFAPDANQADHMARLQLADLVLDTAPYGAHTTASDALWAGIPVVTMRGDTFAARVAGSLLHAVGLPDLIGVDAQDYFNIAHALAAEPARLAATKARLRAGRADAPLFDVVGYTSALERLYEAMWTGRAAAAAPIRAGR